MTCSGSLARLFCWGLLGSLLCLPASAAPLTHTYHGIVDHVVDGDTVKVKFPAWARSPFSLLSVRVAGIDTPEHVKPPAKCDAEVMLGKQALAFAKTLAQPGDKIKVRYVGMDKYFRIDAAVVLPDGRDWGKIMIAQKYARPYSGGTKGSWCTVSKRRKS